MHALVVQASALLQQQLLLLWHHRKCSAACAHVHAQHCTAPPPSPHAAARHIHITFYWNALDSKRSLSFGLQQRTNTQPPPSNTPAQLHHHLLQHCCNTARADAAAGACPTPCSTAGGGGCMRAAPAHTLDVQHLPISFQFHVNDEKRNELRSRPPHPPRVAPLA